jgi:hypothetical protein
LIVTSITIKKLRILCPDAALTRKSAIGIGYSALGVALLRSLKSMQTRSFFVPFSQQAQY